MIWDSFLHSEWRLGGHFMAFFTTGCVLVFCIKTHCIMSYHVVCFQAFGGWVDIALGAARYNAAGIYGGCHDTYVRRIRYE